MEEFNEDELELLRMISDMKPYDVLQAAMNQNGTRLSVTVKNNAQQYREFKISRRFSVLGIPS